MLMAVPKGVPVARDGSSEEVVVGNRDGHDVLVGNECGE